MAFGTKVEAKDLIGMTSEELGGRLGKIDGLDARFAKLEEDQRKANETILQRLEALAPKEPVKEAVDPDIDFMSNPTRAMDDRIKPLSQQTNDNTIMLMHRQARETYSKDFDLWGKEIVELVGTYSPEHQGDPRVWQNSVMVVRGRHATDIEKGAASGSFTFLEPVSAGLVDPKSNDGLSPEQRKMVSKLNSIAPQGMTPEKYQRGVERLAKSRNARLGSFAEVS